MSKRNLTDAEELACPHCHSTLTDAIGYTRGVKHADGYACDDCNIAWTYQEWENGVSKQPNPDPDPEHQVVPQEHQTLKYCYHDLVRAVENTRFEMETPRVHATQTTFDSIEWSIEWDTQQHHSYDGMRGVSVGSPYLSMEIEWSDEQRLLEDLQQHGNREAACILYGEMHVWQMEEQYGKQIQAWTGVDGSELASSVEFEWHAVTEIGWR